jgi:hypothetical protein
MIVSFLLRSLPNSSMESTPEIEERGSPCDNCSQYRNEIVTSEKMLAVVNYNINALIFNLQSSSTCNLHASRIITHQRFWQSMTLSISQ